MKALEVEARDCMTQVEQLQNKLENLVTSLNNEYQKDALRSEELDVLRLQRDQLLKEREAVIDEQQRNSQKSAKERVADEKMRIRVLDEELQALREKRKVLRDELKEARTKPVRKLISDIPVKDRKPVWYDEIEAAEKLLVRQLAKMRYQLNWWRKRWDVAREQEGPKRASVESDPTAVSNAASGGGGNPAQVPGTNPQQGVSDSASPQNNILQRLGSNGHRTSTFNPFVNTPESPPIHRKQSNITAGKRGSQGAIVKTLNLTTIDPLAVLDATTLKIQDQGKLLRSDSSPRQRHRQSNILKSLALFGNIAADPMDPTNGSAAPSSPVSPRDRTEGSKGKGTHRDSKVIQDSSESQRKRTLLIELGLGDERERLGGGAFDSIPAKLSVGPQFDKRMSSLMSPTGKRGSALVNTSFSPLASPGSSATGGGSKRGSQRGVQDITIDGGSNLPTTLKTDATGVRASNTTGKLAESSAPLHRESVVPFSPKRSSNVIENFLNEIEAVRRTSDAMMTGKGFQLDAGVGNAKGNRQQNLMSQQHQATLTFELPPGLGSMSNNRKQSNLAPATSPLASSNRARGGSGPASSGDALGYSLSVGGGDKALQPSSPTGRMGKPRVDPQLVEPSNRVVTNRPSVVASGSGNLMNPSSPRPAPASGGGAAGGGGGTVKLLLGSKKKSALSLL
jgi:hypothetical protein